MTKTIIAIVLVVAVFLSLIVPLIFAFTGQSTVEHLSFCLDRSTGLAGFCRHIKWNGMDV